MFGSKSAIAVHDAPELVVFQTPPATPPAYITFGLIGLTTSALVRPPTLPGPKFVH
jgi:hypothetical protein